MAVNEAVRSWKAMARLLRYPSSMTVNLTQRNAAMTFHIEASGLPPVFRTFAPKCGMGIGDMRLA